MKPFFCRDALIVARTAGKRAGRAPDRERPDQTGTGSSKAGAVINLLAQSSGHKATGIMLLDACNLPILMISSASSPKTLAL